MRKKTVVGFLFCLAFLMGSCCTTPKNTVTQVSTIDAILAGVYDGQMTCEQLVSYGDFGIGTFDRLDGEMVLLQGKVYQVRYDGTVCVPPMELSTPFASVARFTPDLAIGVPRGTDFQGLQVLVNKAVPNRNLFCAVQVKGTFSAMETRSVPPQDKPYPPLPEVTKHQPVFDFQNTAGTMVGFRSPPFVKGINVPGYHLHFLSESGQSGGHVLGFVVEQGTAEIDTCNRLLVILPEDGGDFSRIDLSRDRSKELEESER